MGLIYGLITGFLLGILLTHFSHLLFHYCKKQKIREDLNRFYRDMDECRSGDSWSHDMGWDVNICGDWENELCDDSLCDCRCYDEVLPETEKNKKDEGEKPQK